MTNTAADRPALVTGAGRGIGRSIALRIAATGAPVCLTARSESQLEETAAEIRAAGGYACTIVCDLVNGDLEGLVAEAVRELGGLAVVVNNAGGAHRVRPLDELEPDEFELGTQLNYTSVYRIMRASAPELFKAAPHASVVNIVSIAAERGFEGMSYYSGAKAGVVGLSRAAAREWGPRGVRVNCVGPGWIATDLNRPLREQEGWAGETLARVPLGRFGDPDEIANAVAFLISDQARYVTGTTLYVDGGLLA